MKVFNADQSHPTAIATKEEWRFIMECIRFVDGESCITSDERVMYGQIMKELAVFGHEAI